MSSAPRAPSTEAQEDELFQAVEAQLEDKGFLATIRAQLRAAVFEAIVRSRGVRRCLGGGRPTHRRRPAQVDAEGTKAQAGAETPSAAPAPFRPPAARPPTRAVSIPRHAQAR